MYKFRKHSTQMIHFNDVFADVISRKRIGIGFISLMSIIMIVIACVVTMSNAYESLALNENNNKTLELYDSSGNLKIMQSNQKCYWECSPCDMSCYTAWDDLGPTQFRLTIHTDLGWAVGLANCESPGLCDPGNHDIRGLDSGVAGDSHGFCTIIYTGYWVEDDGYGYHHWDVNNYDSRTSEIYQYWSGTKFKIIANGGLHVNKHSTWDFSEYLSAYSMEGCIYDVYLTLEDAKSRVNRHSYVVLDDTGHGDSRINYFANQTLYVRESNRPGEHGRGYHYNDDIGWVIIQPDISSPVIWGESSIITYDVPYVSSSPLSLIKTDQQTGEPGVTEGGVESFENAHYEFSFRCDEYRNIKSNLNKIQLDYDWVMATDENGEVAISEKYRNNKVSGDDFIEWNGEIVMPLGNCIIREVKAPEGYLLSDKQYLVTTRYSEDAVDKIETRIRDVDTGEFVEQLVDPQKSKKSFKYYEQIIRGDYRFIKVNDKDEVLDGIPFKITSLSTGEWHIAVTDNNGIIDTSINHLPHTNNTNINDCLYNSDTNEIEDEESLTSNCGIWFAYDKRTEGIAEANDNLGALPYDTYTIEEIPISINEKYLPFETRTFIVDNHGYLIDGPEWVNKEPIIPPIIPPIVPVNSILPQTGDVPLWIFGLPILVVLCYIMRRWVCYRKY